MNSQIYSIIILIKNCLQKIEIIAYEIYILIDKNEIVKYKR